MGRHKKVCCNICLRVMRSDHLNRHLKVHERREETSKPHHQFYNYNIFKNIKLYKEKTTMGKNKKVDIWACYNCNRWETDDWCHICSDEDMKVVEPEDQPIIKRKFNEIDENQIFNEAYNFNLKKRNKIDSFEEYDGVEPDWE